MSTIAVIGRGNVATHLREAFRGKADVSLVNPHTLENFPEAPDIILLAVKDDAIPAVVDKLPSGYFILAHTSGSVPMSALEGKTDHIGVLYPLQTFTKVLSLDYSSIPVFIEAADPITLQKLVLTASLFSDDVRFADSEDRKRLHLASVFACNFSNAMADIADEILSDSEIPFEVLLPLMRQTLDKLETLSPAAAQTGPAIRGDRKIIASHLEMLKGKPHIAEIYKNISDFLLLKSK